jgi:predicted TIM-barrel fold metal-dependent hydrolase
MNAIDIHVHHRWTKLDGRPDYEVERTRELARRSGVGRALLLTFGARTTPEQLREHNDCTLRLMESDPGFFLGAMYLCPLHDPAFTRQEARRCAEAGMVAIKQGVEVRASDPRIHPIAEVAAELAIPILYHAWYKTPGVEPSETESNGADIAQLARCHPETRIIMAHLTGIGRRGVQDVEDLSNVSVDTSGGWYDTEMVEYAVRHMGADRVLYGSDYPGRDYAPQVGRVTGAKLSNRDRERILWRNAATVLRLGRKQPGGRR